MSLNYDEGGEAHVNSLAERMMSWPRLEWICWRMFLYSWFCGILCECFLCSVWKMFLSVCLHLADIWFPLWSPLTCAHIHSAGKLYLLFFVIMCVCCSEVFCVVPNMLIFVISLLTLYYCCCKKCVANSASECEQLFSDWIYSLLYLIQIFSHVLCLYWLW